MSVISSYKKEFNEANKQLANHQHELLDIDEQISNLLKRKDRVQNKISEDEKIVTEKGLLYYSSKQRTALLNKAESLQYSKKTIARLRQFDESEWNQDTVNYDTIADFEALENYVSKNTPKWESNILAKIGRGFLQNE